MSRIVLAFLLLAGLAQSAGAVPRTPAGPTKIQTTPVAASCEKGRSRDALGRCHHRFNRFAHHGHFRAYKQKHCTPIHTAAGTVNRCKI